MLTLPLNKHFEGSQSGYKVTKLAGHVLILFLSLFFVFVRLVGFLWQ